jgi:hypothetical protein
MFFKKGRGALWVCIWNQGGGGPKKFGNHCYKELTDDGKARKKTGKRRLTGEIKIQVNRRSQSLANITAKNRIENEQHRLNEGTLERAAMLI